MSDFKFSCPACGQNILCDTAHQGVEMNCPSCSAKIVVPHDSSPPAVPETVKALHESAFAPTVTRTSGLAIASLVCSLSSLLVCIGWLPGIICGHLARAKIRKNPALKGDGIALAGLMVGYAMLTLTVGGAVIGVAFFSAALKDAYQQIRQDGGTNDLAETPEPAPKASSTTTKVQPATDADEPKKVQYDKPEWTLDVHNAQIPDHPVSGTLHGLDFVGAKTSFKNGDVKIDSGDGLEVTIHGVGTNIENESFELQPAAGSDAPQIKIKWQENGVAKPKTFKTGYSMKLKFDKAAKRKVRGHIYLCLPDDSKSCVAGTFTVGIPRKKQ